jgi:hypothetical protein
MPQSVRTTWRGLVQAIKEDPTLVLPPLLFLALELLVVNRYGYFRDELYYLASTEHVSLGYVDHPPLSIWILAVNRALLGDSLLATRWLPALLGALSVLMTMLLAREFGGGRFARTMAGLASTFTVYLALCHFYSMNAWDIFFWTLSFFILVQILKNPSPRLWILLGVILGLGLLNKISVLWLGAGIFGAFLVTQRRLLLTRWPWIAGGIAFTIFLPFLLWQIAHGWPTVEFITNATRYKMVDFSFGEFISNQVITMNPGYAPIWIIGLLYAVFSRESKRWSVFGWIFLTVAAVLVIRGATRAYYLSLAYPPIFALGALAIERFLRKSRWVWIRPLIIVVMVLTGFTMLPMALPVLSPEDYIAYAERMGFSPPAEERGERAQLPQHFADMFGWEEMVDTVARVYESLPPEERAVCRIFAQNYGEAGAVDVLGRRRGLPRAMCGHNSYWLWGPGDWTGEVVIIIGGDPDDHAAALEESAPADTIRSRYAMPYENDLPVYIGRDLKVPLEEVWESARFFI